MELNENILKKLLKDYRLNNKKELNLSKRQITSIVATAFNGFNYLRELDLSNNQITWLQQNTFDGLNDLKKLNLSSNKIAFISPLTFKALKSLEELDLSKNNITSINSNTFTGLKDLEVLILYQNKITSISQKAFNKFNYLAKLDLSKNEIDSIDSNAFNELISLKKLYLSCNKITSIDSDVFKGLKNLEELIIFQNEIISIDSNAFNEQIVLLELDLSFNRIESILPYTFDKLNMLQGLYLKENKIKSINSNTFNRLNALKELDLSKNEIDSIDSNAFNGLNNLKELYLHKILCNPNSICFLGLNLEKLTLFDEQIIYEPKFSNKTIELNSNNINTFFANNFISSITNLEYFLNKNSLEAITLKNESKKWKCLSNFHWSNISNKLSVLFGINGVGKTSLLKLIHNSMNDEKNSKLYVCKYYTSSENILNLKIHFTKKLKINSKNYLDKLYDLIDDFNLVQYFDYLLLLNYEFNDFQFNKEIFKYKINEAIFNERKREQSNEDIINQDYYNKLKKIEYYFGLDENHEFSTGEYLIILIELWRIHAKKLKAKNLEEKRPIHNKLRILLLDEPDAHMHPSLIKYLIELISKDNLEYLNLQVIMTTHNPVTISFIPIENLFELITDESNKLIFKNAESKSDLLYKASDELLFIREKFKLVFTEGRSGDDKEFYEFIYSYYISQNIIRDKMPLKFQEMGDKNFNQLFLKTNSCDQNLNELLFGINDGDYNIPDAKKYLINNKNKAPDENFEDNFKILQRYNIENYIYDPINLTFALKYLKDNNLVKSNNYGLFEEFFELIKNAKNIGEFIENHNQNYIDIFNLILEKSNIECLKLIDFSKEEKYFETNKLKQYFDEFRSKLDEIKISEDENETKLKILDEIKSKINKIENQYINKNVSIDKTKHSEKVKVKFKCYNKEFELEYYPFLLYHNGKQLLKKYLETKLTNLKRFNIDVYNFDPIEYYFIFRNKIVTKRIENNEMIESINKIYDYKRILEKLPNESLESSINLNDFIRRSEKSNTVKLLNEIIEKTENSILEIIFKRKDSFFKKESSLNEYDLRIKNLSSLDSLEAEKEKKSIKDTKEEFKYEINNVELKLKRNKILNNLSNKLDIKKLNDPYFKEYKYEGSSNQMIIKAFKKSGFLFDTHLEEMMKSILS